MRKLLHPLRTGLFCTTIAVVSGVSCAQAMKRGAPSSLPPVLTSESVHSTASTSVVPYADNPRDSLASLAARTYDPMYREAPFSCNTDSVICYDYRKRHSVVPMTKSLMPDVPGLKKEGVTVKRDKLAFNYSF
jgi:hypothetical protein